MWENLAETRLRVMAFWYEHILPRIKRGERIMISAHGNSLRALMMDLAGKSIAEIEAFDKPTAMPIIFNFDIGGRPLQWYYLNAGSEAA